MVVAAVVVVLAVGDLQRGRSEALAARRALVAGDLGLAATGFGEADEAFGRARDRLRGPLAIPPRLVPVARQNIHAVATLASAGQRAASAASSLTAAEGEDPVRLLSPRRGALPVEAIANLAPQGRAAAEQLTDALNEVRSVDTAWLLEPTVAARAELLQTLVGAQRTAAAAADLGEALPAFLGAEGARQYYFGAASPSELRGASGLVGAYSLVEVEEGRLSFGDFRPVQELENFPPGAIPAVDSSLEARFARYGGTGFWLNINMTADFPAAATSIERLFERATGEVVDGVIVATPRALAALMEVTGPVEIPGYGTLEAQDAEEVLGNEAYGDIEDPAERKLILGAAAKDVLQRFLSGAGDPVKAAEVLARTAGNGDLLLHSGSPEEQAAFERAGIAGQLAPPPGSDLLAVIGNNAAGNKVDFYMDRSVAHEVLLAPDGSAISETSVHLRNEAPTSGLPAYIIGPFPTNDLRPGENATILSTYCSPGCQMREFERDGIRSPIAIELELGHPVFSHLVQLESGEEADLRYRWTRPGAWQGDARQGSYTLTFLNQATMRPTDLEVAIILPDGVEVTHASSGAVVRDGILRWQGTPTARQEITVEWRMPPGERLRRAFADFFAEPIRP
jgi:hypothetical protein